MAAPEQGLWRRFRQKALPRGLFGRSLLIIVLPMLLLQLIATFIFFDRHWVAITNRLTFAVASEIAMIAEDIEAMGKTPEEAAVAALAARVSRHVELLVTFEAKQALPADVSTHNIWFSSTEKILSRAMAQQVGRPFQIRPHDPEKWYEITVQLDNGLLRVLSPERRLFSSTSYIFILWMIGSSVILLAVAILFMRNQIRPLRRLAIAAERLGKGVDVPRFKPEGAAEVRQAAEAFLRMRDRIRRQIEQRTTMLAGVSHDLRTPLTRMKLQLAMLGDSPDVDALNADIADMERMIEGYLSFTRGEGDEPHELVDLSALAGHVVGLVRRQGADIGFEGKDGLILRLRRQAMQRCIGNLVANAAKYGQRVHVAVKDGDDGLSAYVIVDDDGPGIPPEMREEVFRPFYRLETSRNPATGGVGLGLSIAQDIAHAHGGDITLDDSPMGGLRAVLRLPL